MKTLCSAILVLLLQVPPSTTKGAVSFKGSPMPIVDAVAVWNAAKSELVVALLPFKIEKKHLPEIQKDRIFFSVMDHATPDAKKWPDRCPFAQITLKLDAKAPAGGPKAVESYLLVAYGLQEKNFTHNINRLKDDVPKEFKTLVVKLDPKGGGSVEIACSGDDHFDKELTWDFSVKCGILPATEAK